jgi:putative ABC transport system ATP-binding protein
VAMETDAIQFIDVSVPFGDGHGGISGLTATVEVGKTVTLIGPSGAGKSTLLSLCNLFLTPQRGTVNIFGKNVLEWDVPSLRRQVGMVFQTPVMLPGTVLDNLRLGPKLRGETVDNIEPWLEAVGLSPTVLQQPAQDLSGGQKQRLSLVRTLLNHPKILLLDEVTSALDSHSTQLVEQLVQRVKAQQNCTVLWVTHNLEQARRVGDETWLLVGGRLVEAAPTEVFFTRPQTEAARQFLASVCKGGQPS